MGSSVRGRRATPWAEAEALPHAERQIVGQLIGDIAKIIGVEHLADAHRAIDTFVQQVDQAVAEIERNAKLRMLVHVALDERHHMFAPEAGRRGNLEVAADAQAAERNRRLGVDEIGQDALALFEK